MTRPLRSLALLLAVPATTACVESGFNAKIAQSQQETSAKCEQPLHDLYATYCEKPVEHPPEAMVDHVVQSRNAMAIRCKGPANEAAIARIDACVQELRAHE